MHHILAIVAACAAIGSITGVVWRRAARTAADNLPGVTVSLRWLQEHQDGGQRD
jgi:hypothetical protein